MWKRSYRYVYEPRTAFDTHATVKALVEAGIAEREAEAITDAVRDALETGAATKADLAGLEVRLTRLILTVALAQAGLVLGILKLL